MKSEIPYPLPVPFDYNVFRHEDREGRFRIFGGLSPEEKAELIRTQIRTWVDERRERLTDQQVRLMEENIEFVTAELYQQPRDPELDVRKRDLIARTSEHFGIDEMAQAFTITACDIPDFQAAGVDIAGVPTDPQLRISLNIAAARNETTHVHVSIHPEGETRVLAEWRVTVDPVEHERGTMPDGPIKRLSDVRLPDVGDRVRITIVPETPGARVNASAVVRGADGEVMEIIHAKPHGDLH